MQCHLRPTVRRRCAQARLGAKRSCACLQCRSHDVTVAEVTPSRTDDLVILVSLACDQHHIVRLRLCDGLLNGPRAIAQNDCASSIRQPTHDVGDDCIAIFSSRIVVSDDHFICKARRYFAHERTLRAVTITAASKDAEHLPATMLARSVQGLLERIRRMRVIDDRNWTSMTCD